MIGINYQLKSRRSSASARNPKLPRRMLRERTGIPGIFQRFIACQLENFLSEPAVVAHFIACAAAAAIAKTISAIQNNPRQSLRGGALEPSGAFKAAASKPTTRDSSLCA
jgi:hypothetical protein